MFGVYHYVSMEEGSKAEITEDDYHDFLRDLDFDRRSLLSHWKENDRFLYGLRAQGCRMKQGFGRFENAFYHFYSAHSSIEYMETIENILRTFMKIMHREKKYLDHIDTIMTLLHVKCEYLRLLSQVHR